MEGPLCAIVEHGYQNRSEAIRNLARAGMQQAAQEKRAPGECVAALVCVYDHAARDLSRRLVESYHGHHDLSLATLHVHLDDDNCMEVTAAPAPRYSISPITLSPSAASSMAAS